MNEDTNPTPQQAKYLKYLLVRAHEKGMPHLDTDHLSKAQTSAWIDFTRIVVLGMKKEEEQSSPSFPRYATIHPIKGDHQHIADAYVSSDDLEVVYCTLCGEEW